jgi:hypothetical protein
MDRPTAGDIWQWIRERNNGLLDDEDGLMQVLMLTLVVAMAANNVTAVPYAGSCVDPEQGDLSSTLVWESSKDGIVASGASGTMLLRRGNHTITATCRDERDRVAQATVRIKVKG